MASTISVSKICSFSAEFKFSSYYKHTVPFPSKSYKIDWTAIVQKISKPITDEILNGNKSIQPISFTKNKTQK